jgi:hypothetical protein
MGLRPPFGSLPDARVLITSRFSDWSELADEVALDVSSAQQPAASKSTLKRIG